MSRAINLAMLLLSLVAIVLVGSIVRDYAETWGYVQITLAQGATALCGFCAVLRAALYLCMES